MQEIIKQVHFKNNEEITKVIQNIRRDGIAGIQGITEMD